MLNWLFKRKQKSMNVLSQLLWQAKATWIDTENYVALAREGYMKNVVVYHCIKAISESAADIPIILKVDGEEEGRFQDEIMKLLNRPNPRQSYKTFMRVAIMYRLISGNTYILSNIASTKKIMELSLLRPDRVKIEVNSLNIPTSYVYEINGTRKPYPIDPNTFMSDILHVKEPHPLDDLYGFSPIAAASMAIAQNNESSEWNKKLLENSGRPPGIISMKDKGDNAPSPSPEEMTKISQDIHEKFQKWSKDGRIPVLSFAMDWQSLGMTPTDMNWISGKSTTARDICLAFRYPPFLLGMPEGATYNNMTEAKLALYEEAVIPVVQSILSELAYYISVQKKINLEIELDLDQVPALMTRREIARRSARDDVTAGILTINEAREEQGYDEVDGGDEILVPAGKLPLNFDVGDMTEKEFQNHLVNEGFTKDTAKKLTKIAYQNHDDKKMLAH